MADRFRSLLPPSAAAEERAIEQASAEQITAAETSMVRHVKNPDTCPLHLLPWLAWEFAVDYWDETWSEEQKRQVIRDAAYVHQHRGTAGAVRRSLASVGLPIRVIEWFEETPHALPYTFRVEVISSGEITPDLYEKIRRQTNAAKNLRSWLSSIDVLAEAGGSGAYYAGGAATMFIDMDIPFGEDN